MKFLSNIFITTLSIFAFSCAGFASTQTQVTPNPEPQALKSPVAQTVPLPTSPDATEESNLLPTSTYLPVIVSKNMFENVSVFGTLMTKLAAEKGLDKMAEAKNVWAPRDYPWDVIESSEGARNWDNPQILEREEEFRNTAAKGMKVVFILDFTPQWALKDGYSCGAAREDKFQALGNLVYDLVKRYSAPPYNIKYWQVSNEPDVAGAIGCWGDPADGFYGGAYYGKMLQAVYPRLKQADPESSFLVGGLLMDCHPDLSNCDEPKKRSTRFMEGILTSGAAQSFDGIAFHAYDYYNGAGKYINENWNSSSDTTGPALVAKSTFLRELLARYGVTGKILLNTETAVLCGSTGKEDYCQTPELQETKSAYVVQNYTLAIVHKLTANVWFYTTGGWRQSGLLDDSLVPYPAYYSFKATSEELGRSVFNQKVNQDGTPALAIYEFKTASNYIWVVWSMDGQMNTLNLPANVNRVLDQVGNLVTFSGPTISVDWHPIFVEFQ
jgi:hypothetical protein